MSQLERVGFRGRRLSLPKEMTFEQWCHFGSQIRELYEAVQFALGDWLAEGQERWGRRYLKAIEITGLDYQTLADLRWVADSVDFSRRRENLSFAHHREVAALPPSQQDVWLDRAEAEGLNRSQLREAIRTVRDKTESEPRFQITVSVDAGERDLLLAAAERDGVHVRDWARAILVEAAKR